MSDSPQDSLIPAAKPDSFRRLQDIPLTLCAELDRFKVPVRVLLDLRVGSLLPLSRPTGENISLYASDVLLGTAEILVLDSSLAVRIAELREKPVNRSANATTPEDLS